MHQLPLRPGAATAMIRTGSRAQRRRDRRGADLPLHGLEQPQRRRALRRRRRRGRASGHRDRRGRDRRACSAATPRRAQSLRVRGMGCAYAGRGITLGDTIWDFDGQAIFKRAVSAMCDASARVLEQSGVAARRRRPRGAAPGQPADHRGRGEVRRHSDGEGDAHGAEVRQHERGDRARALVEALEAGRVKPGSLMLMPAFGGGLTLASLLVRWGDRVTPLGTSSADCRRARNRRSRW